MELSPVGSSSSTKMIMPNAECRCPPGTALSAKSNRCHALFDRGPCELGQYFAPVIDIPGRNAMYESYNTK